MKCTCGGELIYDVEPDTERTVKKCLKCDMVLREWPREDR